jgi:hypothetical protein
MTDPEVVIIVTPSRNADGHKACSTRGQLFDAMLDGRFLIGRSTQPLLDACRVLADEGY